MGKPGGTVGPRPEILEEEGVGDKDTPHLPRQRPLPTSLSNSVPHVQHLCDLGPQTMSLEQADKACGGSLRCLRG